MTNSNETSSEETPNEPIAPSGASEPEAPAASEATKQDSLPTAPIPPASETPAEHGAPEATVYTSAGRPEPYAPATVGAASSTAPYGSPPPSTQSTDGVVPPAFGGPAQSGYPYIQAPPPKEKKDRKVSLPIVAAILVAGLIGGGVGAGVVALTGGVGSVATNTTQQKVTINDTNSVTAVSAVAAKALPSVVTINVTSGQSSGTGSGVILSADGYIVTNTHVVTLDGATNSPTITVVTSDGAQYSGKLIGTDPNSDLAVVKISASGLTPIEFGDSDSLNVGQTTVAIGAPMQLSNTVTQGIVSALYRGIEIQSSAAPESNSSGDDNGSSGNNPFEFWNNNGQQQGSTSSSAGTIQLSVIQTDAAINPGNSGGALLNANGKLIGINVAILSNSSSSSDSTAGSIGIGFAIPANQVKRVANEIISSGTASHGLLGASITQTDSSSTTVGAVVKSVVSGGAAASAGVMPGDIVTQFNGIQVSDPTDLQALVKAQPAGASATITVQRNGKTETFKLTLGTYGS